MTEQQYPTVYEFSGYRISEDERLLTRNNDVISLPPKVIDLLLVLLRSGGRVLTKDELMQSVWADTFVEETNLTHNISLLRRVFDEKRSGRKFIETIPRRGYRFVADVRVIGDEDFEILEIERTNTRVVVEEELATEDERLPGTSHWIGRRGLYFAATLAVLAVLTALGVWYFRSDDGNEAGVFRFSDPSRLTSDGNAKMVAVSPDGKFTAYVTDRNRMHALWVQNISSGSSVPVLANIDTPIRSVRFGPSERVYFVMRDAIYYVPILGGPTQKVIDVAAGAANQIFTFSPDGKQIAFMRAMGDASASPIIISDIDGKNERVLASSAAPGLFLRSPDWSPDGERIAIVSLSEWQRISVVSVADGSVSVIPSVGWGSIEQVEWLPTGDALLALVNDGEVWRVEFPGGGASKLSDSLSRYSSISVSEDGDSLVAAKQESDGHIWLLPAADERSLVQLTQGFDKSDGGLGLDWVSNDRIRYMAGRTWESWVVDIDGGESERLLSIPTPMSSISPDKQFIVFQGTDENGPALFRARIADGDLRRLAPGPAVFPRVSPDGKWVVYTLYTDVVSVWKVPIDGGEPVKSSSVPGYALNPIVSSDGSRIAFVWWESASAEALPKIGIVSFADGSLISSISVPMQWEGEAGKYSKEILEWTPDGQAIDFVRLQDGVSNIWRQPVDGSAPTQITFFDRGRIANFAWSPDRRHIALSRGSFASDLFLIKARE